MPITLNGAQYLGSFCHEYRGLFKISSIEFLCLWEKDTPLFSLLKIPVVISLAAWEFTDQ